MENKFYGTIMVEGKKIPITLHRDHRFSVTFHGTTGFLLDFKSAIWYYHNDKYFVDVVTTKDIYTFEVLNVVD